LRSVVPGIVGSPASWGDRREPCVGGCGPQRARAGSVRAAATRWLVALDLELGAVTPAGSELADAVEALMLGVRAWVLRFGHGQLGARDRAMWLTAGPLCGPP
jgi:hypothetical protein